MQDSLKTKAAYHFVDQGELKVKKIKIKNIKNIKNAVLGKETQATVMIWT